MATQVQNPKMLFVDNNGKPLVGAKVYTYVDGTSTPLATYTSYTGTGTTNDNPVITDSRGEAVIFTAATPVKYRFVVTKSTGEQIWTADSVGNYPSISTPLRPGRAYFTADDGSPLSGGLLYTYATETTTPAVTYADAAMTVPNTNPVVLDSRGEAVIFIDEDIVYKVKLATSDGTEIWTVDGINTQPSP